ncbi:MAG: ATP-grasp domain-containing protein [Nocardioides sp.]|uniref:ATP-grasp domain-containing protein n=1 Tax=Nocardioides sp. TaxID=35761 RepID=UPI003D6A2F4F
MSESILVLGAQSAAAKDLLIAAREMGLIVHLATHESVWNSYPDDLRARVDHVVFTNFAAPAGAVDELVRYVRAHGISGVVTGWEFLGPMATMTAAGAGLPGHDEAQAMDVRNKWHMANRLRSAGVPHPATAVATSAESLLDAATAAGLELPFVVKPSENAGSVAVSVVEEDSAVPQAYRAAGSWSHEFPHGIPLDTSVLAQQYVGGPEVSVESLVHRGRVHHLSVTAKDTTSGAIREEIGHTVPALLDEEVKTELLTTVTAALDALGITNGVAHTEVKLPPDGPPTIIEVGARPPGGYIMRVIKHAIGVDMAQLYLEVALGREPRISASATPQVAAIRFLTTDRIGEFQGISGDPVDDELFEIETYLRAGEYVGNDYETWTRIGHVIITGADHDEVAVMARHVDKIEIAVN